MTTTATGPTVRTVARSARGPLLAASAVVLAGILAGSLAATGPAGLLDPDAYDPSGARAVAELLRDRGVEVQRVERASDVPAGDVTVVVPFPDAVPDLQALADRSLVLVAPGEAVLDELGVAAEVAGDVPVETRQPACGLPAAQRAGDAQLGGLAYRPTGAADATGCYASGGSATLLVLPDVVLLGSGDLLTNRRLDERGNAALALGLLGTSPTVAWLLPRLADEEAEGTLDDLVPDELRTAALWLFVVVGVLALWRARRLGPVVAEPLPVVVRAAEAVEGRGRLYRASGARGTAAEQLRGGTRDRVVRRLGLPVDVAPTAVVQAVAERTGRDPGGVERLLYGAAPGDDAALVRLADDLDTLLREVAGP